MTYVIKYRVAPGTLDAGVRTVTRDGSVLRFASLGEAQDATLALNATPHSGKWPRVVGYWPEREVPNV